MMKADSTLRKIAFLIASTFSLLALEILYFMVSIKLLGFSEEEEVKMITFADASTMLAIVGIPICIVVWLKIPERLKGLLAASLVGIGAYFWLSPPLINTGITHAFYAFVMVNIIFALIQVYEKPLHK